MSQRWRAVRNTVLNLTGSRFESQTCSRNERVTARPTGRFNVCKLLQNINAKILAERDAARDRFYSKNENYSSYKKSVPNFVPLFPLSVKIHLICFDSVVVLVCTIGNPTFRNFVALEKDDFAKFFAESRTSRSLFCKVIFL